MWCSTLLDASAFYTCTTLFSKDFSRGGKKQRLPRGIMVLGRNYVHDAIAPLFKLAQEGR
jgi:hypothetical protein